MNITLTTRNKTIQNFTLIFDAMCLWDANALRITEPCEFWGVWMCCCSQGSGISNTPVWDPMILRVWAFFRRFFSHSTKQIPSRGLTYLTWGKGKSSTQKWILMGYVSSQRKSQVGLLFWAKQTQFILMLPAFFWLHLNIICSQVASPSPLSATPSTSEALSVEEMMMVGVGGSESFTPKWELVLRQKQSWLSFATQTIHPNVENNGDKKKQQTCRVGPPAPLISFFISA